LLANPEGAGALDSLASHQRQAVLASLEKMSYHLTRTIFAEWRQVFGVDYQEKEVVLRASVGRDDAGSQSIFLQFLLRENGSIFDLTDRCRWECQNFCV